MDINIGKDQWIKRIRFYDKDHEDLFEIDDLLRPSFDLWDRLETQCMAECCGINAYTFWEQDIKLATEHLDKTELIKKLLYAQSEILKRKESVLISEKLNDILDASVFVQLLEHIINSLQ